MTKSSEQIMTEYEGEMLRKTPDGKFKKYWFCLLGKELYQYRKRDDEKHKGMHSLVGAFISPEPDEPIHHSNKVTVFYPFKLTFPPNKQRSYYFLNKN